MSVCCCTAGAFRDVIASRFFHVPALWAPAYRRSFASSDRCEKQPKPPLAQHPTLTNHGYNWLRKCRSGTSRVVHHRLLQTAGGVVQ